MADIVSYNQRDSFRTPPAPNRPTGAPPLDSTGLLLPKVHLGSFSSMDVGDYFENIGRTPGEVPSQDQGRKSQMENTTLRTNVESFYGMTTAVQAVPSSPLMREKSMSSEGRVWKPRPSPPTTVVASAAAVQQRPSSSPSSNLNPEVGRKPSTTPPTQDIDPRPSSPPLNSSPAVQSNVVATDTPIATSPTRSIGYLPPGAAIPHHPRPTSSYTSGNSMAGVGAIGWQQTQASNAQRRGSSATAPQEPTYSPTATAIRRSQTNSTNPSGFAGDGSLLDRRPTIVEEPSSQAVQPQRGSTIDTTGGTPKENSIPNDERVVITQENPAYVPVPSSSRGPQAASALYPAGITQPSSVPIMNSLSPPTDRDRRSSRQPQPQTKGGPRAAPVVVEEVCIECMMRDRDMADVDVTGEGVWERESDVWFTELVRKEEEEEIRARIEGRTPPSATDTGRPRAKGGRLTEENLKVWLTMNPKEPQARWQTLEAYVKSQAILLAAEAQARAQTQRESRLIDSRLKENYSAVRRSGYEITGTQSASSGTLVNGIPVRVATSPTISNAFPGAPAAHEKDATLLENGMIVERVDLKKEEKEEKQRLRSQERHERQRRRMSAAGPNDAGSVYNASIYSAPSPSFDTGSNAYLANHAGSPYSHHTPSAAQLSPGPRRMSNASPQPLTPRPPIQRGVSQGSTETAGTGVRRFFGSYKHWGGASQSSLAISGSMMDMHLGLDQDRRTYVSQDIPYDLSAPPSLEFGGDPSFSEKRTADPEHSIEGRSSTLRSKKKSNKGLGKLWKLMTGQKESPPMKEKATSSFTVEEDLSAPLAPPPPLSYLVGGGRQDRGGPHSRHLSSPSLSNGMTSPHPRSMSTPNGATGVSPPTAPSSLLPSPTSNRFPWRDSGSDDPRNSGPRDELEVDLDTHEDREGNKRTSSLDPRASRVSVASQMPGGRNYSIDKSLPPLPHDQHRLNPSQLLRPNTLHVTHPDPHFPDDLAAPNAPFRGNDMRRQSFGGLVNKSNRSTWMVPQESGFAPPPSVGARYDEFGGSRRSLGKFEDMRGRTETMSPTPSKRSTTRSRFALSSLFSSNRKSQVNLTPTIYLGSASSATLAPTRQPDAFHARDNSTSHSSYSEANPRSISSHNPRMSVASSKKLQSLVVQDEDFVAYRYPSQTMPLQR